MRALVSFKDKNKYTGEERLWQVAKRGQKYTVVITQNGVNAMIDGAGWYNTKLEACRKLEEYAKLLEGAKHE